jgi:hypothetical protein
MEELALVAAMLCVLAAAGISQRIQGTILTLPMVYAALGFLLSERVLGLIHAGPENEFVRLIAEVTLVLVLVLASDAVRIDLRTCGVGSQRRCGVPPRRSASVLPDMDQSSSSKRPHRSRITGQSVALVVPARSSRTTSTAALRAPTTSCS